VEQALTGEQVVKESCRVSAVEVKLLAADFVQKTGFHDGNFDIT
jgi:hypothetical protein